MADAAISISVKSDLARLTRDLDGFARRQVPFATALALTDVAAKVAAAETGAMKATFDRPTGFTLRAMTIVPARKDNLTASVFVKDAQAHYLAPYLGDGDRRQVLNANRAILMPIDVATNQFGNIPRNKLANLKGDPNVFIGPVHAHGETIFGVWRRAPAAKSTSRKRGVQEQRPQLKLMIRFTAPAPVKPTLHYEQRAQALIDKQLPKSLDAAMTKALATAR